MNLSNLICIMVSMKFIDRIAGPDAHTETGGYHLRTGFVRAWQAQATIRPLDRLNIHQSDRQWLHAELFGQERPDGFEGALVGW
jgi:hypothetical protein